MAYDKNAEQERVEKFASTYTEEYSQGIERNMHQIAAEHFVTFLKAPVLEVGCGSGTSTEVILKHFKHVDVLDGSPELLKIVADKFGSRVTCYDSLVEDFTPTVAYQSVVLASVLQILADPGHALNTIYSWLPDESVLYVTVPNATSLHRRLGQAMGMIDHLNRVSDLGGQVGHYRVYDLQSLRIEVESAGFTIVNEQGIFLKPFSNDLMERLPANVVDGLYKLSLTLPAEYSTMLFMACRK